MSTATLADRSEKAQASSALERMPETATLAEISEELAILAAINEGITVIEQGRFETHEAVMERSKSWIKTPVE